MQSPRQRLSPKFADLSDDWQDKINQCIELAWAEPAHRRPRAPLHLVDHFVDRFERRVVKATVPAQQRRQQP